MNSREKVMHPIYLPFSEQKLKSHFAYAESDAAQEKHMEYYRKSIRDYEEYCTKHPDRKGKRISELKTPCQIEKDEMFWTAACMMSIFHGENRAQQFIALFERAYGFMPPISGVASWEDCFEGELELFFEPNLPSPAPYQEWLSANREIRHLIPYVLESAHDKRNLEGSTNVDAMLIKPPLGFAVIVEAKVLSDISYDVTYDVMRNQIARDIDMMLEKNDSLCEALNSREPDRTLFLLLTPRMFKNHPSSRLYGYKFNEYKDDPASIGRDLPHRIDSDLQSISNRLGWLTWEDFKDVNPNCCKWL